MTKRGFRIVAAVLAALAIWPIIFYGIIEYFVWVSQRIYG